MTPTNEAFEALMPEPVATVDADGSLVGYIPPHYKLYTADQMRQMFDAATERAAKLCDEQADSAAFVRNFAAEFGAEQCATAIRGAGGAKA